MATAFAPPPAAITLVLSRFDRTQLSGFIEVALDLMDLADGDLEAEDGGDEADTSYAEWHTLRHADRRRERTCVQPHEDAEEDDDPGQVDEDWCSTELWRLHDRGAGCVISDPDLEHDGREPAGYV